MIPVGAHTPCICQGMRSSQDWLIPWFHEMLAQQHQEVMNMLGSYQLHDFARAIWILEIDFMYHYNGGFGDS